MIYYKHYKDEIDELVSSNSQYTFTGDQVLKVQLYKRTYLFNDRRKEKRIKETTINTRRNGFFNSCRIKKDFQEYFYRITENIYSKEQLEKIVSLKLIQDVEDFLNQMSNQYNILLKQKLYMD